MSPPVARIRAPGAFRLDDPAVEPVEEPSSSRRWSRSRPTPTMR